MRLKNEGTIQLPTSTGVAPGSPERSYAFLAACRGPDANNACTLRPPPESTRFKDSCADAEDN